MTPRRTAPWLLALCLVSGSAPPAPGATVAKPVEHELLRGVAQIRGTHDRHRLKTLLTGTLARVRRAHGANAAERRARALAIQGFESTLKGVVSLLDFSENDSGEVAAATRDAKRADGYLTLGANQLRAAGRAIGVRIGRLNGY